MSGCPGCGAPARVWLGAAGSGVVRRRGRARWPGCEVPFLPGRHGSEPPVGVLAGLRTPALVRPAVTFSATAMAAGVVVTFVPLAVTQGSGSLAAVALFVQAAGSTFSRWWAGRFGDRHGPAVLLVPGVVTTAAGMLSRVLLDSPVAVLAAMVLFGSGFGSPRTPA